MSARGLRNRPGKFFRYSPTAPGKTAVWALGTICRSVALRARSADEFPDGPDSGQDSCSHYVRNCGYMSYTNHKHIGIGPFGRFFGSSAPMARTLRLKGTKDIKRAPARARGTFLIRVQVN
jgi:hypothetical protein